ncbi:MAG: hypothetical protein CL534_01350 [Ahrensia sp.]|nr:hypothetical protein [Ahrensia sp.]
MQRYRVLQTYVPPLIADWILEQSSTRDTSVSVVIRDHLVAAWNRDNDHADRPGGTDPARQLVFLTTALDALLASHSDETLRKRTHTAYHRRLAQLGFIPAREKEASNEE